MLKKRRKNCSRNIWFSYLLSSFRKRMRFLDQNWLYLVLKEEVGDLIMGKLYNVESQYASGKVFNPIHINEVGKCNIYICSKPLFKSI